MEELIRFRYQIDSLTDDAYNKFSTKIQQSRSSFSTILFNHFKHQMEHNQCNSATQINVYQVNEELKQIITSTKFKSNDIDKNNVINVPSQNNKNINNLSHDLIANIASYLPFSEHIEFEKCNRFIFVSIRSKLLSTSSLSLYCPVTSLYHQHLTHNNCISLRNRFKGIKSLHIACKQYKMINLCQFNVLYKLSLYNYDAEIFVISNSVFDFPTIKCLRFTDIFKPSEIIKVINKCKNIEYIAMENNEGTSLQVFPHLDSIKNIKALRCCFAKIIISPHHYKLESLHINAGGSWQVDDQINNPFINLKELCLYNIYDRNLRNSYEEFTKCKKLERIHILIENRKLDDEDVELLEKILSLPLINFVSMVFDAQFLIKIIKMLNKIISKQKKQRIKIRLYFLRSKDGNKLFSGNFECNPILTFIETMNKYVISDFMFILDVGTKPSSKIESLISLLNDKYLVILEKNADRRKLVVSNINCKINGYAEKWDYHCLWCRDGTY